MINSRDVNELHPTLLRGYNELVRRLPHLRIGVSSTYRDNEYQDHIFAQGRTRGGNIVTNARGGQSTHNYRLAFDIFQNIRGREWEVPFFEEVGRVWVNMGGTWGGNWRTFVDRPHFEYTGALSVTHLQSGERLGSSAVMAWEISKSMEVKLHNDDIVGKFAQSEWSKDAVKALKEKGITDGTRLGDFVTREEAITLLYRLLNYIENK